jgi:hypothetical protein
MIPREIDLLDSYLADWNITAIPFSLKECVINDVTYLPFSLNIQAFKDIKEGNLILLVSEKALRLKLVVKETALITREYLYLATGLAEAIKELVILYNDYLSDFNNSL